MSRKALCVGINNYPYPDTELRGCVNDAKAWARLLIDHYDFADTDVRLLLDDEADYKSLSSGLKRLVTGASKGDVLVFTNASHGTYDYDDADDEPDGIDEAICPFDCMENLLYDDELRELFAALPAGVSLTVISDSCHSGTVTRAVIEPEDPSAPDALIDCRVRFLNPIYRGKEPLHSPGRLAKKADEKYPEEGMLEILLAGCTAEQESHDDRFTTQYHGGMTYYALQAIAAANYTITWSQVVERITPQLEQRYKGTQTPQLEGKRANKAKQIFG